MKIKVVRRETIERNYQCQRCGTRAIATVRARGETAWREQSLFDDYLVADSRHDAAYAALDDAERILSLMHCPECGQQAPRAAIWSAVRFGFWATFVSAPLVILYALRVWPIWVVALLWLVCVVAVGSNEVRRWLAAAKGDKTFANIKPAAAALPIAIARELPPAPIAPLKTDAPDRESAPVGDAPRRLR